MYFTWVLQKPEIFFDMQMNQLLSKYQTISFKFEVYRKENEANKNANVKDLSLKSVRESKKRLNQSSRLD